MPKPISQIKLLENKVKDNLVNNCLPFWINSMEDEDNGRFWKCPYHNSRICMEVITKYSSIK